MLLFILRIVSVVVSASALWSCGSREDALPTQSEQAQLHIVATTGMVRDVVEQVSGDRAQVVGLISSGIDPHLYKPTRSDVKEIMESDALFYSGLHLEGKMTETFERAESSGSSVQAITSGIDQSKLLEAEDYPGHADPHVWMDPSIWSGTIDTVRDTLIDLDPDGEQGYADRAARYKQQMAELDNYCERVLRSVPETSRVLITAHDAFGYFGRRFGYEVVGIQGISTESEAGVRDIERLVDLIVERNVGAVFVESTVSERNINALIAGAKARGHTVVIGGELFSDAMGDEGTYEGTYIGMIDHNATTIAKALGGDTPSRGFQGKLSD